MRTLDLLGLPAGTCNLGVFYLQIQVIHGKKPLRVQVWHLKSKIPVGPGAGNLQVHPCSALSPNNGLGSCITQMLDLKLIVHRLHPVAALASVGVSMGMATDTDNMWQWNCDAGERWEVGSLLMMLVPAKGAEFEIMRKMRCKNESKNEHF